MSKLNLKFGVGIFVGAGKLNRPPCIPNGNGGLKVYAKAAAKVKVFSKTFNVAHLEYSDVITDSGRTLKAFAKLGPYTIRNIILHCTSIALM